MCAGKKQLDFEGDVTRGILMETDPKRACVPVCLRGWKRKILSSNIFWEFM